METRNWDCAPPASVKLALTGKFSGFLMETILVTEMG